MRIHFGSLGALDLIFEQEVEDPATLELQIKQVTENREFQQWAKQVSARYWSNPPSASFIKSLARSHEYSR